MHRKFLIFKVRIQLGCKCGDLKKLWDGRCIAPRPGISEASRFQGHIGERGKKLKVTRAGMNKWADLCNCSLHEDDHTVLSSKYQEKFNQGHMGEGALLLATNGFQNGTWAKRTHYPNQIVLWPHITSYTWTPWDGKHWVVIAFGAKICRLCYSIMFVGYVPAMFHLRLRLCSHYIPFMVLFTFCKCFVNILVM